MCDSEKVLLLVGSPREEKSTSASLGGWLLRRLGEKGAVTETQHIYPALASASGRRKMVESVQGAGLVLLALPLYIDCQPAAVVRAMELIKEYRAGEAGAGGRLAVIMNCGFPEARQNNTALLICRRFAREAGFTWAGALSMGGGGTVSGRKLTAFGGTFRHLRKALDRAADELAPGGSISEQTALLFARPAVPEKIYLLFAAIGWKSAARKNHIPGRLLYARPYAGEGAETPPGT